MRKGLLVLTFITVVFSCHEKDKKQRHITFQAETGTGKEAVTNVTLTFTLDIVDTENPTKVDYAVTGGTALGDGIDYMLPAGTVTIAPNTTSSTVTFTIMEDEIAEGDETIIVSLSNPSNAALGVYPDYTYTITDSRHIGFLTSSSGGEESAGDVSLDIVTEAADASVALTVDYTVTGTAEGTGIDHTLASGTATIPVNSTGTTINFTVNDDDLVEEDETIIVTLSNPNGAELGAKSVYTYTIQDNKTPHSLVFYAPLDGTVLDASLYANTNVFSNITFAAGHNGTTPGAGVFNETTTYLQYENSTALDTVTNVTLSAWVLPVSFYGTGSNPIIHKASLNANAGNPEPHYQYHLGMTGDQYWHAQQTVIFSLGINEQYIYAITPEQTWFPGVWIHVTGTYDGSTMLIYVNGVLSGTTVMPGSLGHYGRPLYIGKQELENDTPHQLPGTFDELRIYSKALTPAEVAALLNK